MKYTYHDTSPMSSTRGWSITLSSIDRWWGLVNPNKILHEKLWVALRRMPSKENQSAACPLHAHWPTWSSRPCHVQEILRWVTPEMHKRGSSYLPVDWVALRQCWQALLPPLPSTSSSQGRLLLADNDSICSGLRPQISRVLKICKCDTSTSWKVAPSHS